MTVAQNAVKGCKKFWSTLLRKAPSIIPPPITPPPAIPTPSLPTPAGPITVQSGDTLGELGADHGFDWKDAQIKRGGQIYDVGPDGIPANEIQPGDEIIPNGTEAPSPVDQPEAAADEAEVQEVEEVCKPCEGKWLVITVERNTKHKFGGRWDCTVGDLKMEIWDEEDRGSGQLVFECKTSERGGPADASFKYSENASQGSNYEYYNQYMIMASNDYGLSAHSTSNYKTYGYSKAYLNKPRPGIAIYGKSSGAMNYRTGVLIHAGTNHRWSVGCIVLHQDGAVRDGRFRFDQTSSVNTLLTFLKKIHEFTGKSEHGIGIKMENVKLIVQEKF